jgi:transposase InsO family protein
MPWTEVSVMESRHEFCQLASREDANIRMLCRRFGISPTTGYLWLTRYRRHGAAGLLDYSRRPQTSPGKTADEIEAAVLSLRRKHPAWGGRKLRVVLLSEGLAAPSPSSITRILHRHQMLGPEEEISRPWNRFEASFPNDLWQMDYKGHFPLARQGRCHPLTVLDDHSRFVLGLRALPDQRRTSVQAELIRLFERFGLPNRILCDNGPPWSSSDLTRYTRLTVWLLHLDIQVSHGRPFHPQTQGKGERFHRTLQTELLSSRTFDTLLDAQLAFDGWRHAYNQIRPHEALGLIPPGTRYECSPRSYPKSLPPIDYAGADCVRTVTTRGVIKLRAHDYYLGEGFAGYRVALRPTNEDALYSVFFRHYEVAHIDLRKPLDT